MNAWMQLQAERVPVGVGEVEKQSWKAKKQWWSVAMACGPLVLRLSNFAPRGRPQDNVKDKGEKCTKKDQAHTKNKEETTKKI